MKIVIIIVLLLLLSAAAIGGMVFMGIGPVPALLGLAPAEQTAPAAPVEIEYGMLDVETLIIPVVRDKQVATRLFIGLRLEVVKEHQGRIAAVMPRLQNAFFEDMINFIPSHMDGRTKPDEQALRRRLVAASERVLGPAKVRDVVITSVVQR